MDLLRRPYWILEINFLTSKIATLLLSDNLDKGGGIEFSINVLMKVTFPASNNSFLSESFSGLPPHLKCQTMV